jgi:hypothetical protein
MPKKIRPKYAVDPVQAVSSFSFNEQEVEPLLNAHPPVEVDRNLIIRRLAEIARRYLWQRDQNQAKPSRAEQNAALTEVSQLAQELELKLRSLDMDTEWELAISVPVSQTPDFAVSTTDFADRLGNLAWAAEQALKDGKKRTGPRAPTHVQRAVTELANLYSQVTANPFTHNPKVRTTYDGTPHSAAGLFILEFFSIVNPSISSTSISTAMASIVRARSRSNEGSGS